MRGNHPWLGPVADGFRVGRLKHVLCSLKSGGTPDSGNPAYWAEVGTPWVAISDMSGTDRVEFTGKSVTDAGIADKRLEILQPGTLLYSMYASLGHVSELAIPATTNQAILGLTFAGLMSRRYAFWQLKALQPYVVETASSNTQDNLNAEKVRNLPFAVPSLGEQQRIANFLDEQTARIDALIAEKVRLDGRLQEYRLSLISAAVTGQIDGKNTDKVGPTQSWPTKRLRYVAELNPAVRPDLVSAQDTEVTFLPMDAIGEDGSLNLERVRNVAEVRNGYSYFEDGDVAFAKVTPCFENGKGALMRNLQFGAGFGTTELTVLRPKAGTCASFLRYVLQSENFRRNGAGAMTGAGGLKRVPDDFTRNFETPWPPHSEQERIAAFLDKQTNSIDALRHHVRE